MSFRGRSAQLLVLAALLSGALVPSVRAQVVPYNPYVDSQPLPPLAPDGTIQWGTFFKSAEIQKKYEHLWKLGACRNTNPDITIPVAANRLNVDALPEEEFRGMVRAVSGGLAGGTVTFIRGEGGRADEPPLVAQFHPAGVTRSIVTGRSSAAILKPGMTVRLTTTIDAKGRAAEPVGEFEIISPPDGPPVPVVVGTPGVVVGTVTQFRKGVLDVRVEAGRVRRLLVPLAEDAVATIDAAELELVSPGDSIEVKGRLWTGEGSAGAGLVFASDVRVRKADPAKRAAREPAAVAVGAR